MENRNLDGLKSEFEKSETRGRETVAAGEDHRFFQKYQVGNDGALLDMDLIEHQLNADLVRANGQQLEDAVVGNITVNETQYPVSLSHNDTYNFVAMYELAGDPPTTRWVIKRRATGADATKVGKVIQTTLIGGQRYTYQQMRNILMHKNNRDFTTMYKFCKGKNTLTRAELKEAVELLLNNENPVCTRMNMDAATRGKAWKVCRGTDPNTRPITPGEDGVAITTCPELNRTLIDARAMRVRDGLVDDSDEIVRWSNQFPTANMYRSKKGRRGASKRGYSGQVNVVVNKTTAAAVRNANIVTFDDVNNLEKGMRVVGGGVADTIVVSVNRRAHSVTLSNPVTVGNQADLQFHAKKQRMQRQLTVDKRAYQKRVNILKGRTTREVVGGIDGKGRYLSKNNMQRLFAGGVQNLTERLKNPNNNYGRAVFPVANSQIFRREDRLVVFYPNQIHNLRVGDQVILYDTRNTETENLPVSQSQGNKRIILDRNLLPPITIDRLLNVDMVVFRVNGSPAQVPAPKITDIRGNEVVLDRALNLNATQVSFAAEHFRSVLRVGESTAPRRGSYFEVFPISDDVIRGVDEFGARDAIPGAIQGGGGRARRTGQTEQQVNRDGGAREEDSSTTNATARRAVNQTRTRHIMLSPHETGSALNISTFRDAWANNKVFPALTEEGAGMRDLGKTNKYGSKLKYWIGSGNTNGTYGLPALCGGAKIYRKGSTRSSKKVMDKSKQKQCDKLRTPQRELTMEEKEQKVLRKCGQNRQQDINANNGNALYKKSDFGERKPTYQKMRKLTLQEALDAVAIPDAANRGALSKLEELILTKLLQTDANPTPALNDWANGLNLVGTTEEAAVSQYFCQNVTTNMYRNIHEEFEEWLIARLKAAKVIAGGAQRSQVFGSDLLEHVVNNQLSRGVYRKNFVLTGMPEVPSTTSSTV